MPVVVQDNSIGQALGALGGALLGDPKAKWEAEAYKQKIANMQADTAKAQLENLNLQRQQRAQSELTQQFDRMFQPGNFNVPQTVEAPRPAPGVMGPMPGMHNPQYDALENKLAFARTAATNAIMRGGNPGDALNTAYAALGQGDILVNGVPTDEAQARQAQTMLTGQIPDAKTPLTEEQRRVMEVEAQTAKLKDAVTVGKDSTVIMSPEQAANLGVPQGPNGQYTVTGQGAQTANGVPGQFSGDSVEVQAWNTIMQYQTLKNTPGAVIPPQLEMAATLAANKLWGVKTIYKEDGNGNWVPVPTQDAIPPGFSIPGATAGPAPAPAPAPAPVTQPVTGGAQPVAPAASVPVQPAMPVQPGGPTGVNPVIQGKPKAETEAVQRKRQFVSTMRTNLSGMLSILDAGYVPSLFDKVATTGAGQSDGTVTTALTSGLWNKATDPKAQLFDTYSRGFLNAILRDESGAAVPEQEYPRYLAALIPQYGDSPERRAAKRELMQAAISAREQGFGLRAIHNMINPTGGFVAVDAQGNPLPDTWTGDASTAPVDPAAPTTPQPQQMSEQQRVQLRNEADAAFAQIDRLAIPSSEKERRKAAVAARLNQKLGVQ
jgi:hypothetical protein